MTALPQDHAVLDCQAHGQPPVTIRWLKNGVRLAESEHIQFLPNGSLYIPKIKHTKEESDEGFYQCLSQNKYGAILSQRSHLTIASKYGAPGGVIRTLLLSFTAGDPSTDGFKLAIHTLWCLQAGIRMASSRVINLEMGSRCTPAHSLLLYRGKSH